jgi:hypothetical protein
VLPPFNGHVLLMRPNPFVVLFLAALWCAPLAGQNPVERDLGGFIDLNCLDCHDAGVKKGGVSLENLDYSRPSAAPEIWELVLCKPAHGLDNLMVSKLSPTLMDRYVTAAQKVARLAVGASALAPGGETIRVRPEVTQEHAIDGLPPGTRGGVRVPYHFPQDGEYEVNVRLVCDRNELVEGLRSPAEVEILRIACRWRFSPSSRRARTKTGRRSTGTCSCVSMWPPAGMP